MTHGDLRVDGGKVERGAGQVNVLPGRTLLGNPVSALSIPVIVTALAVQAG
jgi:hypothetical protein